MRSAIYITEGVTQFVLTPENVTDRAVLDSLATHAGYVTVHRGQFYECQGGWIREGTGSSSLIIVARKPATAEGTAP